MKKFIYFLIALFYYLPSNANWQQTNGPQTANVLCMTLNSSGLYAATAGDALYFSNDQAQHWTLCNNWIDGNIFCLLSVGDTLYAGGGFGLRKSIDNAATWTTIPVDNSVMYVMSLYYDGSNIYYGTNSGLYFSDDYGTTWSKIYTIQSNEWINAITESNGVILIGTNAGNVLVSNNQGSSWTVTSNGLGMVSVHQFLHFGTLIIASTEGSIFVSDDNGLTWTQRPGYTCPSGNYLGVYGGELYSANGGHFGQSHDTARTWSPVSSIIAGTRDIIFKDSILYIATTDGIYLSSDIGQSFTRSNDNMMMAEVTGIAADSLQIFAATNGGGIYSSLNHGINWAKLQNGLEDCYFSCLAIDRSTVYAGTSGKVYYSTNNGMSWNWVATLNSAMVRDFAFIGNEIFMVSMENGVMKSINNLQTMTMSNNNLVDTVVYAIENIGDVIFIGTPSGVFRSINHGISWTGCMNGIGHVISTDLAVIDSAIVTATTTGTFISYDLGATWNDISIPGVSFNSWNIFSDGYNLFACAGQQGVYMSPDKGTTWIPFNAGYTTNDARSFGKQNNRVFLGSGTKDRTGGVWYTDMMFNSTSPNTPYSVAELTISPNPFSGQININYHLDHATDVHVEVYDATGKKVAVIANEVMQQPGSYKVNWENNISGIYFVKVVTDLGISVQKIISDQNW